MKPSSNSKTFLFLPKLDSHFFVAAGRVHYTFMVTTMHSKRQEYFISLGDILFEILEYNQLITDPSPPEVEDESKEEKVVIDVNKKNDSED